MSARGDAEEEESPPGGCCALRREIHVPAVAPGPRRAHGPHSGHVRRVGSPAGSSSSPLFIRYLIPPLVIS
ncbi:unnamed protein product [Lampetra planeri]